MDITKVNNKIAKQNLNFMAVKGESFSGIALGADFVVLGEKFFL